MTSSTKAAAPRICTPSTRSASVRSAAGRALTAHRDTGPRPAQRRAARASGAAYGRSTLGAPGHRQPRRFAGQPQADLDPAGHGGRGDGERLVEALGSLDAAGDLDDEASALFGHGHRLRSGAVHTFFLTLLVLTAVVVTWFAGFVVYRLVKTPR